MQWRSSMKFSTYFMVFLVAITRMPCGWIHLKTSYNTINNNFKPNYSSTSECFFIGLSFVGTINGNKNNDNNNINARQRRTKNELKIFICSNIRLRHTYAAEWPENLTQLNYYLV